MTEEITDPADPSALTSGEPPCAWTCLPLTPAIRAQMQVCLINVEMLTGMKLSGQVGRCVARLDRAVDALFDAVSEVEYGGRSVQRLEARGLSWRPPQASGG